MAGEQCSGPDRRPEDPHRQGARSDGQRLGLVEQLLGHGMRYVGKFAARGTYINKVVDDAYVNMSHMRTYYPRSSALRS